MQHINNLDTVISNWTSICVCGIHFELWPQPIWCTSSNIFARSWWLIYNYM